MDEFKRAAGYVWLSIPIEELIYIVVNDLDIFNALPGEVEIHPRLHVKTGKLGVATVLFQHWLDSQEPGPYKEAALNERT
jgi:hypothetical protein